MKDTSINDPDWVIKYCINRLSEIRGFSSALRHLFGDGGIGGDIDWGIHRWDENTEVDYGVGKFDGYRFYVGPDEHGSNLDEIEGFRSESDLKNIMLELTSWYTILHPEMAPDIEAVLEELLIRKK